MKYRKTALIEAEQFDVDAFANETHSDFIALAVCGARDVPQFDGRHEFHIHTLEGPHMVRHGDWIARGVKGEFWPIKADVFAATYEKADDAQTGQAKDGDR